MTTFLIFLPLPESEAGLFDRIVRTAESFAGTTGEAERSDVGTFRRIVRKGKVPEVLRLVTLATSGEADPPRDAQRARALEDVLRKALGAAGVDGAEARVFIGEDANEVSR